MTAPYTVPPPMMPPRRARRTGRRVLILIIVLLVILGLLFGLDRAAAAYTADRIATKLQAEGFPVKPNVSVEGFPFLTQLISRHLDGVEVTAPRFPVGPVTASIDVQATNITLDSGYQSGTIAQVTGTGLITFASLAKLPALAAVPGLKISSAGSHTGEAVRQPPDTGRLGHRPGEADQPARDRPPPRLRERGARLAARPDPSSHRADTRRSRWGLPCSPSAVSHAGRGDRRDRKQRRASASDRAPGIEPWWSPGAGPAPALHGSRSWHPAGPAPPRGGKLCPAARRPARRRRRRHPPRTRRIDAHS